MHIRAALILAVVATAFACGGDDNNNTNDNGDTDHIPDYSSLGITLDPSHVTITPGATQTVTVNLARAGTFIDASAALTATAAPTGVTFAFDNPSTTAATATLTITAAADATAATTNATITATSGSTNASAQLALTVGAPAAITLHGEVTTSRLTPLDFVEVDIWSHGATNPQIVTTNRDGTFTASNVIPPYDVVFGAFGAPKTVYLGLTRTDPLLSTLIVQRGVDTSTTVTSTLSGGDGYPQPTGAASEIEINCAGGSGSVGVANADSSGVATIYGPIAADASCDFSALQFHVDSTTGLPDSYWHGAVNAAPITFGDVTDVPVSLSTTAVPTHDVSVYATTQTAGLPFYIDVEWTTTPLNTTTLVETDVQTSPYSHTIKAPNEDVFGVFLVLQQRDDSGATSGVSKHVPSSVTSVDVTIPDFPKVAHPTSGDDPVNAASMSFTINGAANSGYFYVVQAHDFNALVATTATTLASSTLAALGLNIPADTVGMSWGFAQLSGITTVDDLASIKGTQSHFYSTDGALIAVSQTSPFSTSP